MPIELGVDVDSTTVNQADAAFGKFNTTLRDAQGRFVAAGKASETADKQVRGFANAEAQAEQRTRAAIIQLQKMQGTLQGVSGMATQVQAVFAGFIGGAFIGGLTSLTMQLQKIDMTFQSVTGSAAGAAIEMAYVADTADKLGQSVLTSATGYAKLLAAADASNLGLNDTRVLFEGLTAAATSFGLSQYELEGALNAVQQMISKGSVQSEELRGQLGERLPGAYAIAARSMGMTTAELSKQLELGKVSAEEFVKAFGPELQRTFGAFAEGAETSGRAINELENATLKWREAIIDSGFQTALITVLDTMTGIVASKEAADVARALGDGFQWMAENAELAAIGIGLVLAAITPWGKLAAIIMGVGSAMLAFTQRTFEVGGETVKVATLITEYWKAIVETIRVAVSTIVDLWGIMTSTISTVATQWQPVFEAVGEFFSGMFTVMKSNVDDIEKLFVWLYGRIKEVFTALGPVFDIVRSAMSSFVERATQFVNMVIGVFEKLYNIVVGILRSIGEAIQKLFGKALEGMAGAADFLGMEGAASAIRNLDDALGNMGTSAAKTFERVSAGVISAVETGTDGVKEIVAVGSLAATEVGDLLGKTTATITTAAGEMSQTVQEGIAGIKEIDAISAPLQAAAERTAAVAKATTEETEKLGRLKNQQAEREREIAAAAGDAADALEDQKKGAKGAADELTRARDVLEEQIREYERLRKIINDVATESDYVAEAMGKLEDALRKSGTSMDDFLKTVGMTRDEYVGMLEESEKMTLQIERQKDLAAEMSGVLRGIAFGESGMKEGGADLVTAITEGMWGEEMDRAFEDLADTLSKSLSRAMESVSGSMPGMGGLSGTQMAGVGTGLGMAAVGALEGNTQQIGSGIGSAAGAVLGPMMMASLGAAAGPVGMIVGGIIGGFLGGMGGTQGDWQEVSGRAFAGTSYATTGTSRGTLNAATDQGFFPEGRIAFDALQKILGNFDTELTQYVRSTGQQVQKGVSLAVSQNEVLKAITGVGPNDSMPYKGEAGKRFAERIATQTAEIFALAGSIVVQAGPPLTQAQVLWRETQEKFNANNVAILKDLGFAAKEIREAQGNIRKGLAEGFERELLSALVDTGRATKRELGLWLEAELESLADRRTAALRTAREIGASERLTRAAFKAEGQELRKEFREMLKDMTENVVETANGIKDYTDLLNRLEGERADILGELTRRVDALRSSEEALIAARRGLQASELAPGGPMDRFNELQSQFKGALRGGDAGEAASLASQLLQQGQQVFASGPEYRDLFRTVNSSLREMQDRLGDRADRLEKRLDADTFTSVTEKSTVALLRALTRIEGKMEDVEKEIRKQNRKGDRESQRKNVA